VAAQEDEDDEDGEECPKHTFTCDAADAFFYERGLFKCDVEVERAVFVVEFVQLFLA